MRDCPQHQQIVSFLFRLQIVEYNASVYQCANLLVQTFTLSEVSFSNHQSVSPCVVKATQKSISKPLHCQGHPGVSQQALVLSRPPGSQSVSQNTRCCGQSPCQAVPRQLGTLQLPAVENP